MHMYIPRCTVVCIILTWAILREVTKLTDPFGSRGWRALNILFWSEVSVT